MSRRVKYASPRYGLQILILSELCSAIPSVSLCHVLLLISFIDIDMYMCIFWELVFSSVGPRDFI